MFLVFRLNIFVSHVSEKMLANRRTFFDLRSLISSRLTIRFLKSTTSSSLPRLCCSSERRLLRCSCCLGVRSALIYTVENFLTRRNLEALLRTFHFCLALEKVTIRGRFPLARGETLPTRRSPSMSSSSTEH